MLATKTKSKAPSKKEQQIETPEKEEKIIYSHDPVLKDEILELLELKGKRNIIDATLGLGGHSKALLDNMPKSGKVICFDVDKTHMKRAKMAMRKYKDRCTFINSNFANMCEELSKTRIKAIDAVLFDLGLASPHIDDPERGFSFMREGPLDMRFDNNIETTAADIINEYSEKRLIEIFKEYGEERRARKLALEIRKRRKSRKFKTTKQLADFVEKTIGRHGRIHPATRIFQALRIEVNKELEVLQDALKQAVDITKPGGRIAVISYHSLEDRIVKNYFRALARPQEGKPLLKIITKKPITPTDAEIELNPRARSAKLRVAEKI